MKRNLRNLAVAVAATTVLAPAGIATANRTPRPRTPEGALGLADRHRNRLHRCGTLQPDDRAVDGHERPDRARAMKGTYTGGVMVGANKIGVPIATPVNLIGEHGAVIDATGDTFGIAITGTASGTTVRGFTVENAADTGIIVVPGSVSAAPAPTPAVTDITIADNRLTNNGATATSTLPGGWGIHLMSATDSTVADNRVSNNGGGIYLTDEFGPNAPQPRPRQPRQRQRAAVRDHPRRPRRPPSTRSPCADRRRAGSSTTWSRTTWSSATAPPPGRRHPDGRRRPRRGGLRQRHRDNIAIGNGLAGVVIHQHGPGDLNNNVIIGNRLVAQQRGRRPGLPGPAVNIAMKTGHIVVANAVAEPITGTVITHNRLRTPTRHLDAQRAGRTNTIAHNWFAASITTPIKPTDPPIADVVPPTPPAGSAARASRMPEVGIEPTRPEGPGSLSPLRLPFRHSGTGVGGG